VLFLTRRNFLGEQRLQKGAVRELLLRRLLEERGQALRDARQAQMLTVGAEELKLPARCAACCS
jgi:hypothetical protein